MKYNYFITYQLSLSIENMKENIFFKIVLFFFIGTIGFVQQKAATIINNETSKNFKLKQLIIPTLLISYGFIGIDNNHLKELNFEIREEVIKDIERRTTFDDFF